MAGSTPNLDLYLPGGGSTNIWTPDEVADIDPLNNNFLKIDTWAGVVGERSNRNLLFRGPAASIGLVTGMVNGDEYQETDGDRRRFQYNGTDWIEQIPPMLAGTAAQRAATTSRYWQFWRDTDGTELLYVGNRSGGWRQFCGTHSWPAAAWATTQSVTGLSLAGRTINATLPTVLEPDERIFAQLIAGGSGFTFIGPNSITPNANDTTFNFRYMQIMSTDTQAGSIYWQIAKIPKV